MLIGDPPEFAAHLSDRPESRARFRALRLRLLGIIGDRPVHYVPNPGNLGDALIRHGTRRFLDDAGIAYQEHRGGFSPGWADQCGDAVLLYGGGGAWCRYWSHGVDVVRAAAPMFQHVVVLPSTFETSCKVPGVTCYARDRLESLSNQPDAIFCDDMALYLALAHESWGEGDGRFFRMDEEAAGVISPPPGNIDISAAGNHLANPFHMVDVLAGFRRIHTDRLHVAILAALVGKRVHLHAGGYFKNRAVFESSLRGVFPRVRFYEKRSAR